MWRCSEKAICKYHQKWKFQPGFISRKYVGTSHWSLYVVLGFQIQYFQPIDFFASYCWSLPDRSCCPGNLILAAFPSSMKLPGPCRFADVAGKQKCDCKSRVIAKHGRPHVDTTSSGRMLKWQSRPYQVSDQICKALRPDPFTHSLKVDTLPEMKAEINDPPATVNWAYWRCTVRVTWDD